jgi:alpha-galactosidase
MPKDASFSWQEDRRGITLESPYWKLRYDLLLGLLDLRSIQFPRFFARWARARALYQRGNRTYTIGTDDGRTQAWKVEPVTDAQGSGLHLSVRSESSHRPALEIGATIYKETPLLVLDLALHNTLPQPITVQSLDPLEIDPEWGGAIHLGSPISGLYSIGWQSWSPGGWKPANAHDRRTLFAPLIGPALDAPLVPPLRGGDFQADMVGVLTSTGEGPALLCGLLSTADQFGSLHADLRSKQAHLVFACSTDGVTLAPNERITSERIALLLARPKEGPLEIYGEALGHEMQGRVGEMAPTGWCSWTAFYEKLSEQDILRQVEWLAERRSTLPVEVVQIDDGWEKAVGDWEANERFPHGMAWLSEQIRQAGFTPGLWLAPYMVHPRSRLAETYPDWLVKNPRGRPASAGYNWGSVCHGLDVTHPDVQQWIYDLFSTVVGEWGYTYLKLDFLYAAAIPGERHRPDLSRAQILRRGLHLIRQAVGPKPFFLGCGCPLGPAIGIVDAMRISADIAPYWLPRRGLLTPFVRGEPLLPGMANAAHNDLCQAWMHRRLWLNDPDALIMRQKGNDLTENEVRSLTTLIALTGGSWMLGDDLPALEANRERWAAATLPLHPDTPTIPDLLRCEMPQQVVLKQHGPWGKAWIVTLFNWDNQPRDLAFDLAVLDLAENTLCHLYEFWSQSYQQVQGRILLSEVEAHDCRTLLVRPIDKAPQWIGSTLHLIQGQPIETWQSSGKEVSLTLNMGPTLEGNILLWLPQGTFTDVERHGCAASLQVVGDGVWNLFIRVDEPGRCDVAVNIESTA